MAGAFAFPINRPVDANGLTMSGAKAYFYATNTLTPIPVYTDSALSVAHASPVVADAGGLFPEIFLDPARTYRLILKNAAGVEQDDVDPISGASGSVVVTPQQFGAVGGGVTDDGPAFVAALAYLHANVTTGYGYGKGSPTLFIPAGVYNLNTTTLDINHSLIIEGESDGGFAQGGGSVLKWAANTTGIRTQRYNTTGAASDGTGYGSSGTTIRNLTLYGGFVATEGEYHGIHMRDVAVIRDVLINGFQGDGIYTKCNLANGAFRGSSSGSIIENVTCQNCRNGIYIEEADANALVITNPLLASNRRYGLWSKTTLGSTIIGGVIATNGVTAGFPTMTSIGGSRFYTLPNQEAGAKANPPKSSTVTMTIASPAVVTWTAHGLVAGTPITFSTTGALPTGLVANTTYYVLAPAANTFNVAATVGGAAINTTGSQSGVHTSAASVNNTYWGYFSVGGPISIAPAWVVNTTDFLAGGTMRLESSFEQYTIVGTYREPDSAPVQIAATCRALILAPMLGDPVMFDGSYYPGVLHGNGSYVFAPLAIQAGLGTPRTSYARLGGNLPDNFSRFGNVAGREWAWNGTAGFYLDDANTGTRPIFVTSAETNETFGRSTVQAGVLMSQTLAIGYSSPGRIVDMAAAAPTTGYHAQGEIVWNNAPAAGGIAKWICTVSGTPGTWVAVPALTAKDTGWTADTGTAKKTATATYTPGANLTYSAAYVQAEQTATSTRLQLIEPALRDATQEIKALKDALIAAGLIGT